jgi:hypothetical protein
MMREHAASCGHFVTLVDLTLLWSESKLAFYEARGPEELLFTHFAFEKIL